MSQGCLHLESVNLKAVILPLKDGTNLFVHGSN